MTKDNSRWLKAAVLGSIWASSEIVLGSFLHNLGVPFCGYLLTAIGICLLTAGHRLWPERGILWRAGLICAVMKAVSPSAVILGPMTAIFMEGLMLEGGTLLLGRNPAGYMLGGGLAMSWGLIQKILKLVIIYGADIYQLYVNLYAWMVKQFGLTGTDHWTPVLIVLALHLISGMAAAGAGFYVGSKVRRGAAPRPEIPERDNPAAAAPGAAVDRTFSLKLLLLNLALLPVLMVILTKLPLAAAFAWSAVYMAFAIFFSGAALRKLKKPGFWLWFIVITLLAATLLDNLGKPGTGLSWNGIFIGLRMNLRAIVLMTGFSIIGAELRNPLIVDWLAKHGAGDFFATLEICFESLPFMIAALPPAKEILARPLDAVSRMIGQADFWLKDFQDKAGRAADDEPKSFYLSRPGPSAGPRVFVITGPRGAGKSGILAETVDALKKEGVAAGGISAPGLWRDGKRYGFDAVNLGTGERAELCRKDGPDDWPRVGQFRFRPEGIEFGRGALALSRLKGANLVVIDEIGPWELEGGGWAPELELLLKERKKVILLVVRKELLEKACARWKLAPSVWEAVSGENAAVAAGLLAALRGALPPIKHPLPD